MKLIKTILIIVSIIILCVLIMGGWMHCKYSTGGEADNGWFFNSMKILDKTIGEALFCRE